MRQLESSQTAVPLNGARIKGHMRGVPDEDYKKDNSRIQNVSDDIDGWEISRKHASK